MYVMGIVGRLVKLIRRIIASLERLIDHQHQNQSKHQSDSKSEHKQGQKREAKCHRSLNSVSGLVSAVTTVTAELVVWPSRTAAAPRFCADEISSDE